MECEKKILMQKRIENILFNKNRNREKKRYYVDTEFIEYPCTIDLISIGIWCEDGRSLYNISSEFVESKASQWVKDNVISRLNPTAKRFSRAEIRENIINFLGADKVEFWGYFADYDWVVFCWLFGTMISLPKNFPMYCLDLKQEMKRLDFPDNLKPVLNGEHNALNDAKWNHDLHQSIIAFEKEIQEKKVAEVFSIIESNDENLINEPARNVSIAKKIECKKIPEKCLDGCDCYCIKNTGEYCSKYKENIKDIIQSIRDLKIENEKAKGSWFEIHGKIGVNLTNEDISYSGKTLDDILTEWISDELEEYLAEYVDDEVEKDKIILTDSSIKIISLQ